MDSQNYNPAIAFFDSHVLPAQPFVRRIAQRFRRAIFQPRDERAIKFEIVAARLHEKSTHILRIFVGA